MEKSVPLINVAHQNQEVKQEILASLEKIIDSSAFILGPEVAAFEEEFRAFTGVKEAVSCASGTDALLLPLMAMDLKYDDEVIVPAFTFYATAASVVRAGAKPVFVDSDESYNLCLNDLAKKITAKTKAVVPVYLFGQMLNYPNLQSMLSGVSQKVFVLEDVAQSMGAAFEGRQAGTWGDYGAFSFYPTKNLGAMGDAGMMSAANAEMAEKIKMLRVHGSKQRYYHEYIGTNSRLDSFQAVVLRIKLKRLKIYESRRRAIADRYFELFRQSKCLKDGSVTVPVLNGSHHVWNQFTIRVKRRDQLRLFLSERKIGSEVYYPMPLHLQKAFAQYGCKKGDLPLCEAMAGDVLSLPMYPELPMQDLEIVVDAIDRFYST